MTVHLRDSLKSDQSGMASPFSHSTHSLAEIDSGLKRKASEQLTAPQDTTTKKPKLAEPKTVQINETSYGELHPSIGRVLHDFTRENDPSERTYATVAAALNRLYSSPSQPVVTVDMLKRAKEKSGSRGKKAFWEEWDVLVWRSTLPFDPFPLWDCLHADIAPTDEEFTGVMTAVRARKKKNISPPKEACAQKKTGLAKAKVRVDTKNDSDGDERLKVLGLALAKLQSQIDPDAMWRGAMAGAEELIKMADELPPGLAALARRQGRKNKKYLEGRK